MLIASVLGLGGGLLLFHLRGARRGSGRSRHHRASVGAGFLWALLFILLFGVLLRCCRSSAARFG
jgi:hypothetical protein